MGEPAVDLRLREQLSNLEGLLVVFMLMTESANADQVLQLAATSLTSLSQCRFVGVYLRDSGWWKSGPVPPPAGTSLSGQVALLADGGGLLEGEAAWTWGFPVRVSGEDAGFIVVDSDAEPLTDEFLLIRLLAWQTGSALTSARLHDLAALRRSVQLRDELLSGISHDMQTPLAAILGLAQTLSRHPSLSLAERTKAYGVLTRQSRTLHALVQQFMLYAQLEENRGLNLALEPTDVGAVVAKVVDLFSHRRRILYRPAEPLPRVLADFDRLEQVLSNLVSNAVKFSPAGTPVRICAREADGNVEIAVIDEGLGMDDKDLASLFQKFHRGANATRTTGSGLGLYLTRELIRAQQGHIRVESRPGHGSTFTVVLQVAEAAPEGSSGHHPRVLVVDDENDIRLMARIGLESAGWQVEEAASGEEALEVCRARPPDIVVLDQRLPGLAGIDVARALRNEQFRAPIFLFSGYIDPEVEPAAAPLGVTLLSKSDVLSLIEAVGEPEHGPPAPSLPVPSRSWKP